MKIYEQDNLVIRWTFGETISRPTSLQAFDMLKCSIYFANLIFPNARKVICFNSLKTDQSLLKLKEISKNGVELHESKDSYFEVIKAGKNSFWKYYPMRIDPKKHELILDNDIVIWKLPERLLTWLLTDGLLINTDWNGSFYGAYQTEISSDKCYNAGILGYPPDFNFSLPDYSLLPDLFHSEQGFIVKTFLNSGKQVFALSQDDIFQANSEKIKIDPTKVDIINSFSGGHFCGCAYSHYFDWDKYYKDAVWNEYYKLCDKLK